MRLFATVIGVIAALVMICVSGSMNFLFMASLGQNPIEGYVLGGASAAADVIKALLPFWIASAWAARRFFFVPIGIAVFLFFTAFSFASALGFAAANRGHLSGTREGLTAQYEGVGKELADAQAKRAALPQHRPGPVIEEAINGVKQDRRWSSSRECAEATAVASRQFCEDYFKLRSELASAVEEQRYLARIARLHGESEKLKEQGAGQDKDPQVSLMSSLFNLEEGFVRNALVIFAALLVEIGSGLGLYLATANNRPTRDEERERAATPVSEATRVTNATPARRPRKASAPAQPAPALLTIKRDRADLSRRYAVEARPVGDVDVFCLHRIQPADEGSMTPAEIYAGYIEWCAEENFAPVPRETFEPAFDDLAHDVGITKVNGAFVGVVIGGAEEGASASVA